MELSREVVTELEKLIVGYLANKKILSPDEKAVIKLEVKKVSNNKLSELLQAPISEICLSTKAFNALDNGGVKTVAELLELDMRALLRIRYLGRKSARECRDKLQYLGFELGSKWCLPGCDCWKPDF